jgi:hypothetical protein
MAAIFFIISSDWLQVFRHPDRSGVLLLIASGPAFSSYIRIGSGCLCC